MDQDKRQHRELKRTVKRNGSKRRRRQLKRDLAEHPNEAQYDQFDFGRDGSAWFNGRDEDATRKTKE